MNRIGFVFFKQKTAYEMRISDWSQTCTLPISWRCSSAFSLCTFSPPRSFSIAASRFALRSEERRVGKECVIRVDRGGRRIIKKKTSQHTPCNPSRSIIQPSQSYIGTMQLLLTFIPHNHLTHHHSS